MPFNQHRLFPWFDILWHKYVDFYFVVTDLLVESPIMIEAVEASSSDSVERHLEKWENVPRDSNVNIAVIWR
jgi:hypothetical protein